MELLGLNVKNFEFCSIMILYSFKILFFFLVFTSEFDVVPAMLQGLVNAKRDSP